MASDSWFDFLKLLIWTHHSFYCSPTREAKLTQQIHAVHAWWKLHFVWTLSTWTCLPLLLIPVCQDGKTDYNTGQRWLFIISISLIFSQFKSTPVPSFLHFCLSFVSSCTPFFLLKQQSLQSLFIWWMINVTCKLSNKITLMSKIWPDEPS